MICRKQSVHFLLHIGQLRITKALKIRLRDSTYQFLQPVQKFIYTSTRESAKGLFRKISVNIRYRTCVRTRSADLIILCAHYCRFSCKYDRKESNQSV